jgi:hypothetical protein
MSSFISSLATTVAQAAHAHASALLASRQAQPGDKLPLSEIVKENEAAKPITLAPAGRNIFVRMYIVAPGSPRVSPFFCVWVYMRAALTKRCCCHKGRRAWGVHAHLQLSGTGLH